MLKSVLSEDIWNGVVAANSPIFNEIHEIVDKNSPLIDKLNQESHSHEDTRDLLSKITGTEIDDSVTVFLPMYSDFGKHLAIGKHVFINSNVIFTDLGGITLEDHVLIGPRANILSVNHPIDPYTRRGLIVKPVTIKKNAWIGAAETILPGITIGENSIVGANAVVTKDVLPNTIVAGNPARIVRNIEE